MSGLWDDLFGSTANTSADSTIALNSISATANAASAYLLATLESTTPEVRRLFSEYTTQSVMANENLMELAVNKNWMNPYQCPETQLQQSLSQSSSVISNTQS